ncbi:MAG: hypothetical protein GF355_12135 [Candidatus Eisenbacteria bacterium]|nr:hypothetical protein [Candidatus Eisenbacteria bacterium]
MKHAIRRLGFAAGILSVALPALPAAADYRTEAEEAMEQTRDEWNAVKQSMTDGKAKLKEFLAKYEEYDEIIWDQTNRRDLKKLADTFGWGENATQLFDKTQGVFNELHKAGFKDKLERSIAMLEQAEGYAKEVDNIWEWSEKWDPNKAHDNPTYGLRRIADILDEGAGKLEALPLVGGILGRWVRLYADTAKNTAAALDRLDKQIQENVRQHNLCGQHGHYQDEQAAFHEAASGKYAGQACSEFFLTSAMGRLRSRVFAGDGVYYIYDPGPGKGFFAPIGWASRVYRWWDLLLERPTLDAAWLASYASNLSQADLTKAAEVCGRLRGLYIRTDEAWIIAEELGLDDVVATYGQLDGEACQANYLLDSNARGRIDRMLAQLEQYLYLDGTVVNKLTGDPLSGANVQFSQGARAQSLTSGSDGRWRFLMQGRVGDRAQLIASKDGFETTEEDFKMHQRVFRDLTLELRRIGGGFQISGTVLNKANTPPTALAGATVTATIPADPDAGQEALSGSDVSGSDGSYAITLDLPASAQGRVATVTATLEGSSAAIDVVITGSAKTGVDLILDVAETVEWTISGTVVDQQGAGLANAVVSGGPTEAVTDAGGAFAFAPVEIGEALAAGEKPSYSLSATVSAEQADGTTVPVASSTEVVTYAGEPTSTVTLVIEVEVPQDVTVNGIVRDANGVGVAGATVSSDRGLSCVSTGGGSFALGPIPAMTAGETVTLTPSFQDPGSQQSFGGTPVTVTYEGQTPIGGVALTVDLTQHLEVTLSGRVVGRDGVAVDQASVACGGVEATAGGGQFSLAGVPAELGKPLTVTATVVTEDGTPVTGSATVTPTGESVTGVTVTLDVETSWEEDEDEDEEEDGDDDLDEAIEGVEDDGLDTDLTALLAAFDQAVADAAAAQRTFQQYANSFDQRLRELATDPCENQEVAYSLVQAGGALDEHDILTGEVAAAFGALFSALTAADRDASEVQLRYQRVVNMNATMHARYAAMRSQLTQDYGCDEDEVTREGEEVAEPGADPDDIDVGGAGNDPYAVEICGDGVDNDGDNQIDECDAGCCEGRAVVIVSDCGTAADDVFLVQLDTGASGVTPVGASTTFSDDLSPGVHTVTLTVLSAPDDAGTYCLQVIVDGVTLLDTSGSPAEGTVVTETFEVPEPGAAMIMRANPILHPQDPGLYNEGR